MEISSKICTFKPSCSNERINNSLLCDHHNSLTLSRELKRINNEGKTQSQNIYEQFVTRRKSDTDIFTYRARVKRASSIRKRSNSVSKEIKAYVIIGMNRLIKEDNHRFIGVFSSQDEAENIIVYMDKNHPEYQYEILRTGINEFNPLKNLNF